MNALRPTTALRRAANLRLRIFDDDTVAVVHRGQRFVFGPDALTVLDVFRRPLTFEAGLAEVASRARGTQATMDLTSMVVNLARVGILVDASQATPSLDPESRGFGGARVHISMLGDRSRTSAFIAAVQEVVRPGDTVLDIGTGTGVLAVAAAQAGAEHVFAVEAGGMAPVAEAVFEANECADRITLLRGWSTEIELPRRADVLVAEVIGNDPFEENALETFWDAGTRLLKPSARVIPSRVRAVGQLVRAPDELVTRVRPARATLDRWRAWYGVELKPLADAAGAEPARLFVTPKEARAWPVLSTPTDLVSVDLDSLERPQFERRVTFSASSDGECNAVLVSFELGLGPTTRLSVAPDSADEHCNWRLPVVILPAPLVVAAGERVPFTYAYRGRSHLGPASQPDS